MKGDRTVLLKLNGAAVVEIEEAPTTFKIKGTVFLLSDSLLIILNQTVKDARGYDALVSLMDSVSVCCAVPSARCVR